MQQLSLHRIPDLQVSGIVVADGETPAIGTPRDRPDHVNVPAYLHQFDIRIDVPQRYLAAPMPQRESLSIRTPRHSGRLGWDSSQRELLSTAAGIPKFEGRPFFESRQSSAVRAPGDWSRGPDRCDEL